MVVRGLTQFGEHCICTIFHVAPYRLVEGGESGAFTRCVVRGATPISLLKVSSFIATPRA